jgi:hypothetical protein
MPLHIVGISNNRVWTTTRISESQGFTPWIDVGASADAAADAAGAPKRLPANAELLGVGCAMVDDGSPTRLHVCVSYKVGNRVGLVHTVETSPGQFFQWGDAHGVAFSNLKLEEGVDCAGIGAQLHVCVIGNQHQQQPAVWRSIRIPSRWSPARIVSVTALAITDVGCAAVPPAAGATDPRPALHVLTRVYDGRLLHDICFPTGRQTSMGDLIPVIPGLPSSISNMAASGFQGDLSVVAADGTNMFLARRRGASGFDPLINLRDAIQPGFAEPLTRPACAYVGGDLHIIAIAQGRIRHGIRRFSDAFRNPESSTTTMFGDVISAAPPGPAGSAPAMFTRVSCAGHTVF